MNLSINSNYYWNHFDLHCWSRDARGLISWWCHFTTNDILSMTVSGPRVFSLSMAMSGPRALSWALTQLISKNRPVHERFRERSRSQVSGNNLAHFVDACAHEWIDLLLRHIYVITTVTIKKWAMSSSGKRSRELFSDPIIERLLTERLRTRHGH